MSSVHSEQSNEEPGRRAEGTGNSAQLRQVIDPAVALVFEVEPNDLRAPTRRSPRTAFARQVAMYLAHVACGLSMMEVGVLFSRDRTIVPHACEVVEDRRDDPDLDKRMERLECAVVALIGALSWRRTLV